MSRRSSRLAANVEKIEKEQEFMLRVTCASEEGLRVINAGIKGREVAAEKKIFRSGDYVAAYQGELHSGFK